MLRSEAESGRNRGVPVIVERVENLKGDYSLETGSEFVMVIPHDNHEFLWIFDANVLAKEDAEKLSNQFFTFLKGIASNPSNNIYDLPILTDEEQNQLIFEWNNTNIRYPNTKCMHELFMEQAHRTPESIAVIYNDRQITYRELNDKSTQLAVYLRSKGVRVGDFVGIFMERSIDLMIGLLGILKSGGAYIPFDPIYPKDRISFMMEDSQLSALLTQSHLEKRFPDCQVQIIQLDSEWNEIDKLSETMIQENANHDEIEKPTPENLAYVIYTSGSTGKPKGVQVLHRGLTNFLCSMSKRPGLTSEDKILALTTICFDIAGLELYLPLINGGQVEILPTDMIGDGFLLKEKLENSNASIIQATPTTWQMLITAGWNAKKPIKILCGGEALSNDLAEKLLHRGQELWNLFGPTETTIWSSLCQVKASQKITIGRPIANTQMYILDSRRNPVPVGISGELHIGGDGVGAGYLNRPELTQDKFIPNPFHKDKSNKLYKTGDLARYLPDGSIEFLNRNDNQTKIHGFRIELGEIESVLRKHPDVRNVIVIVREYEHGNKKLVAYILPIDKEELVTPSELRKYLQENLPSYMLPSSFIFLETFPLTPNGKIDKHALSISCNRTTLKNTAMVPRTKNEELITEVWRAILQADEVGIHDSFFDAGGDSILLIQVLSKLKKIFPENNLTSVEMFKYPTIFSLSKYMCSGSKNHQEENKGYTRIEARTSSRTSRNRRSQLKQEFRKSVR